MRWSRRDVFGAGLAGAGWLTLGGVPASALGSVPAIDDDDNADAPAREAAAPDDLAGKTLNLVLRYRTDPDRIARLLPPGLEPDEVGEVAIDWWLHYPERDGENLFFPGPYTESGIHVTARWQGRRGMFQIGMPLDQDWGRVAGRENVGLVKKDGTPHLERRGRRVRADLVRRGKVLYRVETEVLDTPAHPMLWHRETGFGAFLYRYRLDPDWRRGPLGPDPVELWLRVLGGKRGVYPTAHFDGAPRECDLERTRFAMVEPSPLDPFAELPLHALVGVSYRETALHPDADERHQEARTPTRIERLQYVDPERFAPWALYMYDRPITAGRAWTPAGWPREATAMKLDASEIARYRERDALELELRDVVAVDLEVPAELHARLLPPGLDAGRPSRVRILALDIAKSDVSTEPFHEMWLLARCLRAGRESWYALSHLVGPDGDVVSGRETFGYPSRMASIEWSRDRQSFALAASRLGRRVASLVVSTTERSAQRAHDDAFDVVGLRLHPAYRVMTERGFEEPGPRAELVTQPWTIAFVESSAVEPARLTLELPADAGPGRIGKPDPWYELAGSGVERVIRGRGVLRRSPGRVLATLDDYMPWYAERLDGTLDSAKATSGDVVHTFLVGKA